MSKRSGLWAGTLMSALMLSNSSVLSHAQEADEAAGAPDRSRRFELAGTIVSQMEQGSGRAMDPRYRDSLKSDLASRSVTELESIQSSGLIVNNFGDSSADLVYTPVVPCRVLDTRSAVAGVLVGGTQRNFLVSGNIDLSGQGGSATGCNVPFGPATSVVINFAAVTPAGSGNLRAWAVANPQPPAPQAAVMNYSTTLAALANGIAVPLCDLAAGPCATDLRLQADVSSVHVVADVVGYFARPRNTVTVLWNDSSLGAVDPDVVPVICQTTDVTPSLNQRAIISGNAALLAAGAMSFRLRPVHSSNGGTTWTGLGINFGRGSASAAGEWATSVKFATFDLVAATQYRFGMQISRDTGTADATDVRCDTLVQLLPR